MGGTDYGSQTRTVRFYAPADAEVVNKIGLNVRKVGLYEGGYLTKVSDVSVTLSQIEVEIGDGTYQIRVETANTVTVTVAVATPYVILRWAYTGATSNYMDVMAVAVGNIQDDDVVIGKCNFTGSTLTGFDYEDRTNPNVFERFCHIVPEQTASMYLRVRAGHVNFGSENYDIVDQKTSVFSAPVAGSRIDLVYIDTDGTIAIEAGVADASPSAPDYDNKLVLAEITLAAAQTTITETSIKDVRSFLSSNPTDVASVMVSYIYGCELVYVSTSRIQISAGTINCTDGTDHVIRTNAAAINVDLAGAAANTWYDVYAVADGATGFTGEIVVHGAATAGTNVRRVGSIRTNASSQISQFTMFGKGNDKWVYWYAMVNVYDTTDGGGAWVDIDLSDAVPSYSRMALVNYRADPTGESGGYFTSQPDEGEAIGDAAWQNDRANCFWNCNSSAQGVGVANKCWAPCSSAQKISFAHSGSTCATVVVVCGYMESV